MRQDRRTEGVNPTEVARCYAEGSSLLALQRRFGVGASTVARWLESMGIPRRAAGSEKHSVAMGVVARRSAAGESAESLGRSMGVSANTIRRRLRDIGMDCGRERGRVWTARGYLCAIGRSGSIEHIHE